MLNALHYKLISIFETSFFSAKMNIEMKVDSLIKYNNNLRKRFEKLWEEAKDFPELLLLNRKFLLGEIPETPYHCGSIMDETKPLVKSLLRLHKLQLLTDDSQPYLHEFFQRGEEWVECQQRPFVDFTMSASHNKPKKLLALLNRQSDIVVRASEVYSCRILPDSDNEVEVSRQRTAKKINDLSRQAWKPFTCSLAEVDYSEEDFFCLKAMKRSKPVVFNVAAREWGNDLNLLNIVENAVMKCNLSEMHNSEKKNADIK